MAEGGTCQDTGRNRPTEAHSQAGDSRGRHLSGHERNRPTEAHSLPEDGRGGTCQDTETNRQTEAHSPTGDSRGRHLSGHGNKPTDRGALTSWRRQREALVRTRKQTDRLRCTHFLETAEGGTCQDTGRNRPTEAHSLSGYGRGRFLSGHENRPTDRGALTP